MVGGCLALLVSLPVWAGQTALPMTPSAREQKVFLEPGSSISEAQAAHVAADHYNLPFIVGSHLFTLRDINNEKRQANRGFYRSNDEPWPELMQALGQVQNRFAGR